MKKMDLLVSVYTAGILISELMGAKTFHLFDIGSLKFNASVAIFLLPIIFTVNDIIIEVFGKERARSIIRSNLVIIAFLVFFALFATWITPSARYASTENAYDTIFKSSARISAASLTAFALAEFTDVLVFVKIREKLKGKALWFRNNISNYISQLIDTTIFMTLAFYGTKIGLASNISFLFGLILPYWLIKCFMSTIETPLTYLGVKWLKNEK